MALLINVDGLVDWVTPVGEEFTLDEIYHELGIDIVECVRLSDRATMWLDEEGKLKRRRPNPVATMIFRAAGGALLLDVIVGPVLICENKEAPK